MPLSLKTIEMQIKGDQWNKRFRTVQVLLKHCPTQKNSDKIIQPYLSNDSGKTENIVMAQYAFLL